MKQKKKIVLEQNEQFTRALHWLENTREHVFVTGRAGTGKSTLLTHFRAQTQKNVVVLAPTGVAAVNVNGQTIHSFFHFKPDVTPQKVKKMKIDPVADPVFKRLETIVIDEISMVRADLLDCVDIFLRWHGPQPGRPFGGVQMVFIGDLYQLPPVVSANDTALFRQHYSSPYFFAAHVFAARQRSLLPEEHPFQLQKIELTKVYRQNNQAFISLLNSIRDNTAGASEFACLNARLDPEFDPLPGALYVYLTTTNAMAEVVNKRKLEQLTTDDYFFRGQLQGNCEEKHLPTTLELHIKVGSQVMMLNNDAAGRWYNGTIGRVVGVESMGENEPRAIAVCLDNGELEMVTPYRWQMYQFKLDKKAEHIESEAVGSFEQYPLKLAWAVTIHKSQGKTFERVVIDVGSGTFSPGQLYVALSRATTLEGIVLKRPLKPQHVWLDERVKMFENSFLNKDSLG